MKKSVLILTVSAMVLLSFTISILGQEPEQDCINAIPICNSFYDQENAYSGSGNIPNEINGGPSCLGAGEKNGVWYRVEIASAGDLAFDLIPNTLSNDYDWAVYDLTNAVCSDIFNNAELEVACNYSPNAGVTGPNGGSGDQEEPIIPVEAGDIYVIYVSNFEDLGQDGYILDLTSSSAIASYVGEAEIVNVTGTSNNDNVTGLQPFCGINEFFVEFNLILDCNSFTSNIDALTLTNENGLIYNIEEIICMNESLAGSQLFKISVDEPLEAGLHELSIATDANDENNQPLVVFCGEEAVSVGPDLLSYSFEVIDLEDLLEITSVLHGCGENNLGDGDIELSMGGYPTTLFDISWSNGEEIIGEGITSLTDLPFGVYTVEIGNGDCQISETIEFNEPDNPILISVIETTTDCQDSGTGTIEVLVDSGNGPFIYELNGDRQNEPIFENLMAGYYSGKVIDVNNCQVDFEVTVEAFELTGPAFENSTIVVCEGESADLVVNPTNGNNLYEWTDPNGLVINEPNESTVQLSPPIVEGLYTLTVESVDGICSLTDTVNVRVDCMTGIEDWADLESSDKSMIKVYPNPAKDQLNIMTNDFSGIAQNYSIEVFDILGKLMFSQEQIQNQNNSSATNNLIGLDVADWNSGIYFVKVFTDKNVEEQVLKFIKE